MNRSVSRALILALAVAAALAACKKDEPAAPVASTEAPAVPATPAPEAAAPAPVSAIGFTVGNAAAADKSVAAVSTFTPTDKIVVSVKTDASTAANAAIAAKLTYQDGQVAGEQTANVVAEDAGTTNITFTKATPWPAGSYTVDVTLNGQPVGTAQTIAVK